MARFLVPMTVHLFFRQGSEVLLLRRFRTGYEDGSYSVPAGHLDGGETVLEAGAREAREECAVEVRDLRVAGVMHRRAPDREQVDFFVEVPRWDGDIRNAEPDRCDDLRFFPVDRLPANVVPYVRRALSCQDPQPWFVSYGWSDRAVPPG